MNDRCLDQAIDKEGRLKVHLVPMPSGDEPWRTREEYKEDRRRDDLRFRLTILSLVVSIIGVAATTAVAIWTITSISGPS